MTKASNKDEQRYIRKPHLPLRNGQEGRFLGVFDSDDHWIGSCFIEARFTGPKAVRGIPDGARFRNETIGVTYEFRGLWMPVAVAEPNACRYCDIPRRDHGQHWVPQPGVGRHGFTEPTDQQRLHRMQWRRWYDGKVVLSSPDKMPFTLAKPKKTRRTP